MMSTNENMLLWEQRMNEKNRSGMTVKDWCEKNGISKHKLYSVPVLDAFFAWADKVQLQCKINEAELTQRRKTAVSQPNINYMMNMTKEFLSGRIYEIAYTLDFPYELEKRYNKMHKEDDDYCELIYECLYEEGISLFNDLSDAEFKKLIRKQYNYIKNAREGFY